MDIELKNTKIDFTGRTEEEKRAFQEYCFSKGYYWAINPDKVKCLEENFYEVGGSNLVLCMILFNDSPRKNITKQWFAQFENTKKTIKPVNFSEGEVDKIINSNASELKKLKREIKGLQAKVLFRDQTIKDVNIVNDRLKGEIGILQKYINKIDDVVDRIKKENDKLNSSHKKDLDVIKGLSERITEDKEVSQKDLDLISGLKMIIDSLAIEVGGRA